MSSELVPEGNVWLSRQRLQQIKQSNSETGAVLSNNSTRPFTPWPSTSTPSPFLFEVSASDP
ncbi:hypothetical protein E2C01_076727 [Portunus trituberculatus]|uniref:Uncharacterized protein n=1 Tax=Portunus trituberculatus TaxID=210409 RepID=A0A5B7IDY0_PORTR|nr:hypothetical protein [Portunus trituberculatus]